MMDSLNEAASQLQRLLVDEPALSAVSAIVTDDNDKYQTVSDVVEKCADKIQMQRCKSLEVCMCVCVCVCEGRGVMGQCL